MTITNNVTIALLFLLLALIAGVGYYSLLSDRRTSPTFICTMDALVCPDGSAVGRTGGSCKFTPCPSNGEITGKFSRDGSGAYLTLAPSSQGMESSTVALILGNISIPSSSIGKQITAEGAYQEGSTFVVTSLKSGQGSIDNGKTSGVNIGGVLVSGGSKVLAGVQITLNGITSDSRCPVDVQCIQAGSITANVTLASGSDNETVDINSMTPYMFGAYRVAIVDVFPVRKSGMNLSPATYRVSFTIEKTVD